MIFSRAKFSNATALVFVAMIIPGIISATTYTVCSSGCDYTTLQNALNNVASGNTIQLNQNITEDISLDNYSKTLTIQSDSTRRTWTNNSSRNLNFTNSGGYNLTFTNIDFRNNSGSEMVYMNQSGTLKFYNDTFINSSGSGRLIEMQNGGNMYFYQCELGGNAATVGGIQIQSGVNYPGGIYMENSIVRDIGNGYAFDCQQSTSNPMITLYNCTLKGNSTAYYSKSAGVIKNTLFLGNSTDLNLNNSASTSNFTYCGFSKQSSFGGTGNLFGLTPANVVQDMAGNNLHLICSGNSVVDAGVDMSAYYTVDKDGITRPQGNGYDMGAYECPGINLAKSSNVSWAYIGDTVTYCLTYTNSTTSDMTTELWDTVPGNMVFVGCTNSCDTQTFGIYNVVHWSLVLGAGQYGTQCFYARVTDYVRP